MRTSPVSSSPGRTFGLVSTVSTEGPPTPNARNILLNTTVVLLKPVRLASLGSDLSPGRLTGWIGWLWTNAKSWCQYATAVTY
ncbi:hypothetical protein GCM10010492_72330 [Saccharothrix mutabilis subsp. mutabilis]|uniref:Uncharacterized protein n=1 Tax=Saccharothrix mutabilis subsp. mutabilis TaxID=66855 RepID=A0ABP3EGI3_9PSEU|nr:hypothetical protein GCM10017745_75690 [Saccharothrix mutabilis subsp. capreolus]